MKHILKPVGHCLATVVITSTMLKVYPAPVAEAAGSPDVPLSTASTDAAAQSTNAQSATAQPTNEGLDASSESPASAAASAAPVTVETIVAPEVAGSVVSPPSPEPAASVPTPTAPASQSGAASEPIASPPPASLTAQPEKPNSVSKSAAKQPPAAQPESLAAMRQQLDEKLAAIVARDKATREAQLQQNLIQIALQYAETRAFEEARQVAQHPALPLELQTALLAQIDQIAAQIAVPTPEQGEAQSLVAAALTSPVPSAAATGRTVPGNVAYVPAYVPIDQPLPITEAFTIPQQCSATEAPAQAAARPAQVNEKKPLPGFSNRVAATLAATVKQSSLQETVKPAIEQPIQAATVKPPIAESPIARLPIANPAAEARATAKPLTEKPIAAATAGKPSSPQPLEIPQKATPATQPQQLAVPPASVESVRSRSVDWSATPTRQAQNSDRFTAQPVSPIEIMGYWIGKPLKQAGIRLPFMSALVHAEIEAQAMAQASEPQTVKTASDSDPAEQSPSSPSSLSLLSSTDSVELADRSADLRQPVLSISPYLLDLKQSLAEPKPATKDPIKLSPPAVAQPQPQTADQKTATPQTASLNCFSPAAPANIAISPAVARQMGWGNLVFPLPIPAVLTSAFGWRIHPISGDRRFHAGIDLGAPMGTPVVAAMAGRVVAADNMGGYGLAVIVETATGAYRNLYAHLSGIAVRPGTVVQQGSVLGWVGSTGNSTGPHLHFETQIPTENGWTAIDPLSAAAKTIASRQLGQGGGE